MRSLTFAMPLLALLGALPARAEMPVPPLSDAERSAFQAEVHDYLIAHPEVLMEMMSLLDARQKAAAAETDRALVAQNSKALFDDGHSWVAGNPDGAVTIVEFLDYQCAFCHKSYPDLQKLLAANGDIRLIIKDFPILGPGSDLAARAATAAMIEGGPEAYGKLNAALMTAKGPLNDASLDAAIARAGLNSAAIRAGMADAEVDRRLAANRALAEVLQISGTPTFVVQDQMVRGYLDLAEMQKLVDSTHATN